MRKFKSGGYRDGDEEKYQYARFFSPEVLRRRAEYMHKHRYMAEGSLRDPDNWKKGLGIQSYMDGLVRHLVDVWLLHETGKSVRPESGEEVDLEDALVAIIFNAEGWLYELVKDK